ncbi:hypothetical protein MMAG44476_31852 [Mycolicibacterium mageritense DSM 44476 = CIP 104973]|uniref:Major facilitator superfamily (MFS) profile domain-containing protein n=1 Tax=Mycolicibacterium mageritense TaxID=53462 RepID=A0ABM7HVZ2_MYCME|nr:hypothetical protein [Mycolicibacterium mageritense]MCC9183828.1 hypothetical protein [Mycolicibacterium mageritense]BBX34764.1 hypothetical protein MMAGJ_40460 [Mycolicibacterium mageritense]CDO20718.1 hypothetical protein BN978_01175 [Mycolicibacterium mageritense DSM 44476 = CIP 104973]
MYPLPPANQRSEVDLAIRIVAGVFASACATAYLFTVGMVLDSRFNPNSGDVHGYGIVFGSILSIPIGLVLSLLVPLIFPRRLWLRAFLVSVPVYTLLTIALFVFVVSE